MKILKFDEFISEKLNIKPLSSDRLQKEADGIPNFYLYKGKCGDKNDVYSADVLISENPLPQYDNHEEYKNQLIGKYHSFDQVKKVLDDMKTECTSEFEIFSAKLKDYAKLYFNEKTISNLLRKHVLFGIDDSGNIIRIYSVMHYSAYIKKHK